MTDHRVTKVTTRKVFDWAAVPDPVVRKFLDAVSKDAGELDALTTLARMSPKSRRTNAERRAGRPPKLEVFIEGSAVVEYVRGPWLKANPASVDGIVDILSVGLRRQAPASRTARLKWVASLNRTATLRRALWRAFRDAYKIERQSSLRSSTLGSGTAASSHTLRGHGAEGRALYPHQVRAHDALDQWLAGRGHTSGLVVLPTGAGKTATAVSWLLAWLAGDCRRRVLWLAHQTKLVDQAARSFIDWAATQPDGFERRLRVIHSAGSAASALSEKTLTVAVATMQSVRPGREPNKLAALKAFTSRPTIIVVDEAHRSSSDTYAHLLDLLEQAHGTRVLGLTATPNPVGAKATHRMRNRFPHALIRVDPDELVRAGILARPTFHKVETKIPVHLSVDEARAALSVDFTAAQLRRLAIPVRNRLIVDQWLANRGTWGKTLVFATSIDHADVLADAFTAEGVEARALHSRTQETWRGETLDWFREAAEDAVLVSVGMLTEGVDLPSAQTAFLTRPTTSPVLLRQMIGRVLRGPSSGGTQLAHLVTFHDEWDSFTGTIEAVDLAQLPGEWAVRYPAGRPVRLITDDGETVPKAALEQVRRLYSERAAEVAHGAAVSRADLIGFHETAQMRIPVFAHQQASLDALADHVLAGGVSQLRTAMKFFGDDPLPHPAELHVTELLRHLRETGSRPAFKPCRVVLSAHATAAAIIAGGDQLTAATRTNLVQDGWDQGGQLSYPTLAHWQEAVDAVVRDLERRNNGAGAIDPENATGPVKARHVDRDLKALFRDVAKQAATLLDTHDTHDTKARLQHLPVVRWSDRPLSTSHAHWRWRPKRARHHGQHRAANLYELPAGRRAEIPAVARAAPPRTTRPRPRRRIPPPRSNMAERAPTRSDPGHTPRARRHRRVEKRPCRPGTWVTITSAHASCDHSGRPPCSRGLCERAGRRSPAAQRPLRRWDSNSAAQRHAARPQIGRPDRADSYDQKRP